MFKTSCIYLKNAQAENSYVNLLLDTDKDTLCFETDEAPKNEWSLTLVNIERQGSYVNITIGQSGEMIKITDVEFIRNFKNYLNQKGYAGHANKLKERSHLSVIAFVIALIGILLAGYFYGLPWMAEKAAELIPEEYDNELGDTFTGSFISGNKVDSLKTTALNQYASNLKLNNTKKLKFYVVDDTTVNAFAVPNGSIVVFTGIINKMKTHEELAALIGHEVTHVNRRHSMKALCRSASAYIFISAILGDVNGLVTVVADNMNTLQNLSYSRSFEEQADEEGLELMLQNNINPVGMKNLFYRLKESEQLTIPEFLSSHPVTDSRIRYIDEIITKKKNQKFSTNKNLETLFEKLKSTH